MAGRAVSNARPDRMFDLHPDGDHIVLALAAAPASSGANAAAQFVFNFSKSSDVSRLRPLDAA